MTVESVGTLPARLPALDVMRGFAVMGILLMNITAFAWPEMAYLSPNIPNPGTQADIISWLITFVLIDGKMRGLFSILFGASMLLVIEKAEAKGASAFSVHYRRMAWLALFGLAHFFFIWFGDILFLYAIVGMVAYMLRSVRPKELLMIGCGLFALGMVFTSLMYVTPLALNSLAQQPGAPPSLVEIANEMGKEFAKLTTDAAEETQVILGNWPSLVAWRIEEDWFAPLAAVAASILETLPLMLIGMALFKSGYLTGAREPSHYAKRFWQFFPVGLVLTSLLAWLLIDRNFDLYWLFAVFMSWTALPRLLMTLGYLSLLLLVWKRFGSSAFLARVGAAGRAAFSNYLGTSLVMTFIFYGWGLGYYASVPRPYLFLFVLVAWIVMLLWSKPWLERFHYGPLEWLWRSLARWERVPMRKNPPAAIPQSG